MIFKNQPNLSMNQRQDKRLYKGMKPILTLFRVESFFHFHLRHQSTRPRLRRNSVGVMPNCSLKQVDKYFAPENPVE